MAQKRTRSVQDPTDSIGEVRVRFASQSVAANEDLLHHIFTWLDDRDLASVIRVSKTFFSPALRWLWLRLQDEDVDALLSLLPAAVRHTETHNQDTGAITITTGRPIVMCDLERWLVYVPFLRDITFFGTYDPSPTDLQTFQTLVNFVPRNVLFPNLKSAGAIYSPSKLELLKTLLTPSLQSIFLHGMPSHTGQLHYVTSPLSFEVEPDVPATPFNLPHSATYSVVAFLDFLPTHVPHLTELQLTGLFARNRIGPSCANALAACLKALPNLENLFLDNLGRSYVVFASIIRVKNLKLLVIEPTSDPNTAIEDDMAGTGASSEHVFEERIPKLETQDMLCHLKSLDLMMNHSPRFFVRFLSHFQPPLEFLGLNVTLSGPGMSSVLLASIAKSCPNLTDIGFILRGSVPSEFWTSLRELRELDLQKFGLTIADSEDISAPNEHLLNIAKMHPGLKTLAFDLRQTANSAVKEPTLSCLLSVAVTCPNLQDLRLGSLFPTRAFCEPPDVKRTALNRLLVRDSHVELTDFAKFVGAVWPNTSVLGLKESKEINNLLGIVRHMREVEARQSYLRV